MTIKGKIICIERLNNSIYGNPRFAMDLLVGQHSIKCAKTATDAMLGYQICSSWEGKEKTFEAHFTRKGNLILNKVIGE